MQKTINEIQMDYPSIIILSEQPVSIYYGYVPIFITGYVLFDETHYPFIYNMRATTAGKNLPKNPKYYANSINGESGRLIETIINCINDEGNKQTFLDDSEYTKFTEWVLAYSNDTHKRYGEFFDSYVSHDRTDLILRNPPIQHINPR